MSDLIFGLTVGSVVGIIVLIVGTITSTYCKWVERRDEQRRPDDIKAA